MNGTWLLDGLLWGSLVALFYTYVGYPLALAARARLAADPVTRRPIHPAVTVVIAARDEAARIAARIENCLAQDYPADRLDVVVVSDGSADGTVAAARRLAGPRVTVVALPRRRGKAVALNTGVAVAHGEIVVFTDARQRFAPRAVAELVAGFADLRVGAVTGELVLEPGAGAVARGVGLYWRLETWMRRREADVDSVVGATGAIYAVRRALLEPLPPGTLVDDLLVPMRVAMRGHRVVVERRALAYDRLPDRAAAEFRRKVRTLAGNWQALRLCPALLLPWRNRLWWPFVSHKLCRLAAPVWLATLLATSVAAANLARPAGWAALVAAVQVAAYGLAAVGWCRERAGRPAGCAAAAYAFVLLNLAALVAAWRVATGASVSRLWEGGAIGPEL